MKALPHKYKNNYQLMDLAELVGYMNCLADLSQYLRDIIKSPGDFINSDIIIDTIKATAAELKELKMADRKEIQTELNNLTKETNP